MPRVPTYEQNVVSPTALPTVRTAPAVQPLDGADKALSQVGAAMDAVYQDEKRKAQTAALYKGKSAIDAALTELEWNQDTGALTRQGEDAFDLQGRYNKQYDTIVGGILAQHADPDVAENLKAYAASNRNSFNSNMARHENGQRQRVYADTADAKIKSSADRALTADGDEHERHIAEVGSAVTGYGDMMNWSADTTKQKTIEEVSKARSNYVKSLINSKRYDAANAYLKQHGDAFTEADRVNVEEIGRVAFERDKAEQRQAINQARIDRAYSENQAFERASKLYFTAGAAAITPEMLAGLTHSGRAAMLTMMAGEQQGTPEGSAYLATSLMDMSARDPQKFLELDLVPYYERMDKEQRNKLMTRRDALMKDKYAPLTPSDESMMARTTYAQNALMPLLGIKKTTDQTLGAALNEIERANALAVRQKGSELTQQEYFDLVAREGARLYGDKIKLSGNIDVPGEYWDKKFKPSETVPAGAVIDPWDLPDETKIDAGAKDLINRAALGAGVTLTSDELVDAYGIWALHGDDGLATFMRGLKESR